MNGMKMDTAASQTAAEKYGVVQGFAVVRASRPCPEPSDFFYTLADANQVCIARTISSSGNINPSDLEVWPAVWDRMKRTVKVTNPSETYNE